MESLGKIANHYQLFGPRLSEGSAFGLLIKEFSTSSLAAVRVFTNGFSTKVTAAVRIFPNGFSTKVTAAVRVPTNGFRLNRA
jgi:hypothetical protein